MKRRRCETCGKRRRLVNERLCRKCWNNAYDTWKAGRRRRLSGLN